MVLIDSQVDINSKSYLFWLAKLNMLRRQDTVDFGTSEHPLAHPVSYCKDFILLYSQEDSFQGFIGYNGKFQGLLTERLDLWLLLYATKWISSTVSICGIAKIFHPTPDIEGKQCPTRHSKSSLTLDTQLHKDTKNLDVKLTVLYKRVIIPSRHLTLCFSSRHSKLWNIWSWHWPPFKGLVMIFLQGLYCNLPPKECT